MPKAQPRTPARESAPAASQANKPPGSSLGLKVEKKAGARPREQLNQILMSLYRPYLSKYPETRFVELLQSRYNVGETRLIAVEQIRLPP